MSASRFRNHVRARPRFMGDFLPILPQGTRFCLGPRRTGLNESGIGQVSGSRSAAELTSARWSMSARYAMSASNPTSPATYAWKA